MASPSPPAAGSPGMEQGAKPLLATPLEPSYCNNTKPRTQHRLALEALLWHAHKRDILELTRVEKIAPKDQQEVHHQTVAHPPTRLVPTVTSDLKATLDKQFKRMRRRKGVKEFKLYIPGAIILNELTRLWFNSQPNPPPFVIIHLANPNNPIPGDTYNTQCKPDFVSRRATIQELQDYLERLKSAAGSIPNIDDLRPAHGEVVSTIEMKLRGSHGTPQVPNYCSGIIRCRLDQTIAFGLQTAGDRWTLWRLSPGSVSYAGTPDEEPYPQGQEWYSWGNYTELLRYITGIHSAECMRDETIKYVPGGGQMWNISVEGVQYRMHPFFASYPLGRVTRVGIAYPTTPTEGGRLSDPVYIKIGYVDTNSRFREPALYTQAHSNGYIPGLCRLVAHELRPYFVQGERHGLRQKEVIVLGTGGEPLNKCESVRELLKVMYDVIETLQTMVGEGILHRDISRGNILCKPNHHWDKSQTVRRLPYIEAMLPDDPDPVYFKDRLTDNVCSLVTDLGHSANIDMSHSTGEVGFERTGTPMYVSGEIAGSTTPRSEPDVWGLIANFGQIQRKFGERFDDTFFVELMELTKRMLAEQKAATMQKEKLWGAMFNLNMLNTGEALSESNFGPVLDEKATLLEQQPPQHQPRHDVESVFWVLVCCLVRALPDGDDDNPTQHSDCIFNDMLYHEIPPSPSNARDVALKWTEKEWKEALHPKLQGLATMLVRMCELLCINWRARSTPSNRFMLHQGFKRLLFMQIREIGEEGIQLNTERPRAVYARWPEGILVDSFHCASSHNSSQKSATHQIQRPKRGADSIADPGETTSSRKRPKSDHPAQVPQFAPRNPSAPPHHQLVGGPLNPSPPDVDVCDEVSETEPMEGLVQLRTEGTVDDDEEMYEERSQEYVEERAIERVAEGLREAIQEHRRKAERLVKMHLDDEAWHQVIVKPDHVRN